MRDAGGRPGHPTRSAPSKPGHSAPTGTAKSGQGAPPPIAGRAGPAGGAELRKRQAPSRSAVPQAVTLVAEEQRVKDQRSRFREGSRGGPAGRHEGVFGRVDAVQNGASVTAPICSERQVVGTVSSVAGTEPGKAPELSDAGAAGRSPM